MSSQDNRYDDIINLPHHVSETRPQMPMSDRAAQFSPFAALTGYDSAVKEAGRLTDNWIEMNEDELSVLNMKLRQLIDNIGSTPEVSITYFKPDERKSGGKYVTISGCVKRVDEYERLIIMTDGNKIQLSSVLDIESDCLSSD